MYGKVRFALDSVASLLMNEERNKILDGTYPSNLIDGRQRKHIDGTKEFADKRKSIKQYDPNAEPSKILPNIDVRELVDLYKGTGRIYFVQGSPFPREDVKADKVIGETWVMSLNKYVPTTVFTISYSKSGVHIFPVNERGRR